MAQALDKDERLHEVRKPEEPAEGGEREPRRPDRNDDRRGFFEAHPWAKVAGFLLLALAVVAGIWYWRYSAVRESTDNAQIEGDIFPVSARVGGTVQQVMVDDNQRVNAGDILIKLDPRDYQVAQARAEGELADARANESASRSSIPITQAATSSQLETAEAEVAAAQRGVDAARATQAQAEANYTKVAADLERYKGLFQKDEVSRQQYDAAIAAEKSELADVEATKASVAASESKVA